MKACSQVIVLVWASTGSAAIALDWHVCPVNQHSYSLTALPENWSEAEAEAESLGLHLATIRNGQEEDWIIQTFLPLVGDARELWIGLFQPPGSPEPAGGWIWMNGEPMSYVNWCSGEPNQSSGTQENYSEFSFSTNLNYYKCWNDDQLNGANGSTPQFGLIEQIPTVPTVSEWGLAAMLVLGLLVGGMFLRKRFTA